MSLIVASSLNISAKWRIVTSSLLTRARSRHGLIYDHHLRRRNLTKARSWFSRLCVRGKRKPGSPENSPVLSSGHLPPCLLLLFFKMRMCLQEICGFCFAYVASCRPNKQTQRLPRRIRQRDQSLDPVAGGLAHFLMHLE